MQQSPPTPHTLINQSINHETNSSLTRSKSSSSFRGCLSLPFPSPFPPPRRPKPNIDARVGRRSYAPRSAPVPDAAAAAAPSIDWVAAAAAAAAC